MILSDMIQMLKDSLGYDLDNVKNDVTGALSNANATSQLNYALRLVSKRIYQVSPKVVFTPVAGTPSYDLRGTAFASKMVQIHGVTINSNPLRSASGRGYGLWTVQELERSSPTWVTDAGGTPTRAFQLDSLLWLYPTPNAAVVSTGNNYVSGQYMAPNLDAVADLSNSPAVPEELHEGIVLLAGEFAADPNVTESEGLSRLGRFHARAAAAIEDQRKLNMRLAESWGTTSGYKNPRALYIG